MAYRRLPTLRFLSLPIPPFAMTVVIPASPTNCVDVPSLYAETVMEQAKVDICTRNLSITASKGCWFVR